MAKYWRPLLWRSWRTTSRSLWPVRSLLAQCHCSQMRGKRYALGLMWNFKVLLTTTCMCRCSSEQVPHLGALCSCKNSPPKAPRQLACESFSAWPFLIISQRLALKGRLAPKYSQNATGIFPARRLLFPRRFSEGPFRCLPAAVTRGRYCRSCSANLRARFCFSCSP